MRLLERAAFGVIAPMPDGDAIRDPMRASAQIFLSVRIEFDQRDGGLVATNAR